MALKESVEVPDPVMLVGLRIAVSPADGLVVRLTTPAKPLRPAIVAVDVPVEPALTVTVVGLAVIVKSWTIRVTVKL